MAIKESVVIVEADVEFFIDSEYISRFFNLKAFPS